MVKNLIIFLSILLATPTINICMGGKFKTVLRGLAHGFGGLISVSPLLVDYAQYKVLEKSIDIKAVVEVTDQKTLEFVHEQYKNAGVEELNDLRVFSISTGSPNQMIMHRRGNYRALLLEKDLLDRPRRTELEVLLHSQENRDSLRIDSTEYNYLIMQKKAILSHEAGHDINHHRDKMAQVICGANAVAQTISQAAATGLKIALGGKLQPLIAVAAIGRGLLTGFSTSVARAKVSRLYEKESDANVPQDPDLQQAIKECFQVLDKAYPTNFTWLQRLVSMHPANQERIAYFDKNLATLEQQGKISSRLPLTQAEIAEKAKELQSRAEMYRIAQWLSLKEFKV